MTKQDVINSIYTKEQRLNIDAALPIHITELLRKQGKKTFWFVMDYNTSVFGKLVNMELLFEEAK